MPIPAEPTALCGVHAELTLGLGLPVNRKRVERLMHEAGIQGLYRRRRARTTLRDPHADPSPVLGNRQFTADSPDRLWITDISEHPTDEEKLYCAAVMDACSRLIPAGRRLWSRLGERTARFQVCAGQWCGAQAEEAAEMEVGRAPGPQ
ncbi:IS3 family transposase [Amycolatopsis sp. NPDC051071]|uniref:IS3 family transposase n=1 Tax=Amycolatopsis sp. NPDC051071 TaxID=3154637 RepID=UPI003425A545